MNEYDKSLLNDTLGLSCIENYLIYALHEQNRKYAFLYYKSYISLLDIINEFANNRVAFSSFYFIDRLHKTAKENGVIISNYEKNSLIPNLSDSTEYLAISIEPEFIKNKYNTTLWRDDHFLLIKKQNNDNYYYLNDNPRDSGIINVNELHKIYSGTYFLFSLTKPKTYSIKETIYYIEYLLESIKNDENLLTSKFIINDIIAFRDIIGILRITRKRIYNFCEEYIDVSFINEYITLLNKTYASIEYMRLRNLFTTEKANEIILSIWYKDTYIVNLLKTNMEKYLNDIRKNY